MRMEVHQVAEGLYKQDISRLPPGRGFLIGGAQEPGDNAAESAQPVALVEVWPQEFWHSKDILPMGYGSQNLIFHPVTVGQHALLMTARAEVTRLAAEGEQIIMAACITIDTGKTLVQITAIDKPVQDKALDLPVNRAHSFQFIIVLTDALVEWTGVGISRAVKTCSRGCLHATYDALRCDVTWSIYQ